MENKISVVIPLYNKERQITRAIDSVLSQSFQDFEIIIVDDGSVDASAAIVASYGDERIHLIRQKNQGVSAARNCGVYNSRCGLVSFLDADDAYAPDFLKNIWIMYQKYPSAVAYAMNYEMVLPDGGSGGRGVKLVDNQEFILQPTNFFKIALQGIPVSSSSVAVKKESIIKVGGFPVGVKLGEDIDTWIRLLFSGDIVFNSSVGVGYYSDDAERAMLVNAPPLHYVFFDTLDSWKKKNPEQITVLDDIEEFKNFFKLVYAHYHITRGACGIGREVLRDCQTFFFLKEKRRLLFLSCFPRGVYKILKSAKFFLSRALSRCFRI